MARSLLVGSLNLESPDAVFAAVGAALRDDVARVPDGETGERLGWIFSLAPRFAAVDALELAPASWGEHIDHHFDQYRPRDGVAPEDVEFGNLGYADDASRRTPASATPWRAARCAVTRDSRSPCRRRSWR